MRRVYSSVCGASWFFLALLQQPYLWLTQPSPTRTYIDFGTNQAAGKIAAKQANAAGNSYSYCYETGPGHYSLYFAS